MEKSEEKPSEALVDEKKEQPGEAPDDENEEQPDEAPADLTPVEAAAAPASTLALPRRSRAEFAEASFLRQPKVNIIESEDTDGVTWYVIQVVDADEERTYRKRYNDFRELDVALKAPVSASSTTKQRAPKGDKLPALPQSGFFGLRHKLDIGDFNAKRQQRLQEYLQVLVSQVGSLAEEPCLDMFFSRELASRVLFKPPPGSTCDGDRQLHNGFPGGADGALVLRTQTDLSRESFRQKNLIAEGGEVQSLRHDLEQHGVALACMKGHKPQQPNQDSCTCVWRDGRFRAFGVFDGHGPCGHDVSGFVVRAVMKLFCSHAERDTAPEKALTYAFVEAQKLLEVLTKSLEVNARYSGSTGTVVVIPPESDAIHVAYVGDSRAVLCRNGDYGIVAIGITTDHKPNLDKEKARILAAGGRIEFDGLNHRVFTGDDRGGLSMSRALGDSFLHEAGISSLPDIRRIQIDTKKAEDAPGRDLFLLICSDGIWEFLDNQTACDIVLKHGRQNAQDALAELTKTSYEKWMEDSGGESTDDITALLVWL